MAARSSACKLEGSQRSARALPLRVLGVAAALAAFGSLSCKAGSEASEAPMTSSAASIPPAAPIVVAGSGGSAGVSTGNAGIGAGGAGVSSGNGGGGAWFDNGSGQPPAAPPGEDGAGGTTGPTPPTPMDLQLPVVPCGAADAGVDGASGRPADAGDDTSCVPPPSRCIDDHTLDYYSNGRCVAGRCEWTIERMECPSGCNGVGCVLNFTG